MAWFAMPYAVVSLPPLPPSLSLRADSGGAADGASSRREG